MILAHVAQHTPSLAIAPLIIAAGISALGSLFGQGSAQNQQKQTMAEQIREFNAQLAAQQAQSAQVNGLNQQQIDYTKLSGDRTYASGQDDKQRGIADQRALNPRRAEMMAMLMKRFGSQTPGLTATAPGSYGGNSDLPTGV